MSDKKRPWMKWYPADWRADPKLRMCSLAARGLWADLIALMHEAEPYGHLLINGKAPTSAQLANLVGCGGSKEVDRLLAELSDADVFSRNEAGTIYSRRMVRDREKEDRDRLNGKGGGNPKISAPVIQGVNPPLNPPDNGGDKAHMPEARCQRLDQDPIIAPNPEPVGARSPRAAPQGSRLPDDWQLPPDWRDRADEARLRNALPAINLDLEAEKFSNYWHAQPGAKGRKTDWLATWTNWALRAEPPRNAGPRVLSEAEIRRKLETVDG